MSHHGNKKESTGTSAANLPALPDRLFKIVCIIKSNFMILMSLRFYRIQWVFDQEVKDSMK